MKKILIYFIFTINLFAIDATVEIIKDTNKLPTITIENLNANKNDVLLSSKIYKMLIADLKVSGHFNVVENNNGSKDIDYEYYLKNNINLVIKLESSVNNKEVISNIILYDINIKQAVLSKKYSVSQEVRYPFLSHKMAIDINNYIKAPSIDWMNRFVVFSKYTKAEESHIVVADYTLTFQNTIIRDGLNIFPKWADVEQNSIFFTKYLPKPTLVKYNIYTGKMEKFISSDGLLIISDVSSSGKKVLLTMAPNAQTDIFLYDIEKKSNQKLTNYSGIDVGANFINNEKSIMFISDRMGYPNIFSLDLSSKLISQLVYHGRNNSSASAHNEYVVYSSRESDNEFGPNNFNLYLISTKSDYIRRLTANGINQMPRFSRDGGSIMFIKNTSEESSLGIIRLDYNKSYLFPLANEKIQAIDW
ncbi:Tol-Pal system protein TolB [Helicobacter sp. MIT 14-3879]|uniref:Tol-Pal system protein TolB n=1 Tax=Helicobacter sp. MIT 14-3879 TaxID=2040649 RepID=UPI000E1EBE49|nr:Tol-Pal system protein TolB [Helicobacter sp. MIT 14-3879]RDU63171.1 Tol-Pal system protein TolB [Helicobacter sp. MIT 14-3879]